MIKVYLADDHPVFVQGISRLIDEDPDLELLGTAQDGATALSEILRLGPDVAILDIGMPKTTGLQALSALQQVGSSTRVILLTGSESQDAVYTAQKLGAAGYLLKTTDWDELLEMVKAIASNERPDFIIGPSISHMLNDRERKRLDGSSVTLTEREREIVSRLARNQSRTQIALDMNIAVTTVRNHLARIYKKLRVSSQAAAVAEALRRGFIE